MNWKPRFRILTALFGIMIFAIPLAHYAQIQWNERQWERMQVEIESLGGHCGLSAHPSGFLGIHIFSVSYLDKLILDDCNISDRDLLTWKIRGAHELRYLSLANTSVTDSGLVAAKGLHGLTYLSLSGTPIHGDGLKYLSESSQLELIDLDNTLFEGRYLEYIGNFKKSKTLRLVNTDVNGRDLYHIRNLSQLECLVLERTLVDDKGLTHLVGLNKLKELYLHGSLVTSNGVAELARKLPSCTICLTADCAN